MKQSQPEKIAGYLRISVDTEEDRDNTSIENQRRTIEMFVAREFPTAELDFFVDRDRSGYTFSQREAYMKLRPLLVKGEYDTLIIKDLSRFSRRNGEGLVELEHLRDSGVRIIAINDSVDYPVHDDWTLIQFKFLMNEMPVTDTSKKVRKIIEMRQKQGDWICNVPYGYIITNTKQGTFRVEPETAEIVKKIYNLYLEGWGYKKIANYLTDEHIPTPRTVEKERKEADGSVTNIKSKNEWSIQTVQGILQNDFYIGTLRQRKYTRSRINGPDVKLESDENIVFENNHEPIIEYKIFANVQEEMKKRTKSNYRGIKKYDTSFSGFLFCGDCKSPMFSLSRPDMHPAYTCGTYHRRGLKGCTSHHTRVDMLTAVLKSYVALIMKNSESMIKQLEQGILDEDKDLKKGRSEIELLQENLADAKEELRVTIRQRVKEIQKNPQNADLLEETFDKMIDDLQAKIKGIEQQLSIVAERKNTVIKVNRIAKTAIEVFRDILTKDIIDKNDLDLIIKRIDVYNDRIDILLKDDIQMLLETGTISDALLPDFSPKDDAVNFKLDIKSIENAELTFYVKKQGGKAFNVNVISSVDPLEIYTDAEGEVIFKKYSPIGELSSFAGQYAEVLHKNAGLPIAIMDNDHVIACSGISKREVLERRVSKSLEELMENRQVHIKTDTVPAMNAIEGVDRPADVVYPIIYGGDVSGAIAMLESDKNEIPSEADIKLVQVAAAFLGKQME